MIHGELWVKVNEIVNVLCRNSSFILTLPVDSHCQLWRNYGTVPAYTAKLLMWSLCCDWTVMMWWQSSHLQVALVEGYKTVYLCHLDSYTVTVCNGYLVSSQVVTVQLPTRCLVGRFLHRPHSSGYIITCVSDVDTVQ